MPTIGTTLAALLERAGELNAAQAKQPAVQHRQELPPGSPSDAMKCLGTRLESVKARDKTQLDIIRAARQIPRAAKPGKSRAYRGFVHSAHREGLQMRSACF